MSHALFFGERWDAPVVDDAIQVPTPVGEHCLHCVEPIEDGDCGFVQAMADLGPDGEMVERRCFTHAECDLRGVLGHQVGVCHCTGYDASRATAKLVWQRVSEQRGRPLEDRR